MSYNKYLNKKIYFKYIKLFYIFLKITYLLIKIYLLIHGVG